MVDLRSSGVMALAGSDDVASRARQTQNQSCEFLKATSLTSYKHASLTNCQAFWPDLRVDLVEVLVLFLRKYSHSHSNLLA